MPADTRPLPQGHDDTHAYPARKARQGEIVLRTRRQRIVFLAGLAGAALLAILVVWLSV